MDVTPYQWAAGFEESPELRPFVAVMDRALAEYRVDGADQPVFVPATEREPRLVFQRVGPEYRPYRRRSQAVYVIGVLFVDRVEAADALVTYYPSLIRSLSNLLLVVARPYDDPEVWAVTLERGAYRVLPAPGGMSYLVERIAPLARSHLIVKNTFIPDLPPALWGGTEVTRAIGEAGRVLDSWDLLPAPFPIQDLLSPDDFRHLQRLFGIGGLSYGNLSARHDETRFWMSASGVDKSSLREVGRDILMVSDYNAEDPGMILTVPEGVRPRRVSVDAIEHWMIYREHPSVGAIIHIHAWMPDVPATDINFPCGTVELAQRVAEQVRQAPDPSRAVVGLKNHGLTITGRSVEDILNRIDGRILRQVPMS
ncbi:MAG: class II aldolase/adducin family protein [Firmicutes bacterium]|nr:class II aldolase/adducin family protein [Bacillota bacterium]